MEFLAFFVIAILLVLFWNLRSRIQEYEARLAELTRRVWTLENAKPTAPPPAPMVRPEPIPVLPPPPPPFFQPQAEPEPMSPAFAEPAAQPIAEPTPEPALPPKPKSEEWEAFIGGSLLNKIGALILVVGITLFLGYSFGHLTPGGRAAIALTISSGLLVAGVLLEQRGRYKMFSRGLTGGGWAALYATSYAIYAIPEARIVDNPFLGSLVMLVVAAAMAAHSLHYKSQAATAVAFFAAFAALAVTPNGPFAVVSLIPLAAALLFLAARFEWHWLPLFGLGATYLTCISRGQSDASLPSIQSLFLLYWLLFEGFDLIRTKRGIVAGGLPLLSPLNTFGFLGLSYFTWSSHSADHLWIAATYGAILFFADTLIRAYIRPGKENETLAERMERGSYEACLVISSALAALAIAGRVPGMWSGAALAVEAEVLYLAGIQLASPFIRALGFCAFAFSLSSVLFNATTLAKTAILGHRIWTWTPAALFHAGLFYVNRALRKPNLVFSSAAAILIATVLAAELPDIWIGAAWMIFGALLYELKDDFRDQAYFLFTLGAGASFIANAIHPHAAITALAITLAVAYQATFRRDRILQISSTTATAFFSALLVYRLVPTAEQSLAWMALSILFLLHECILSMHEFRAAGSALAALAFLAALTQHPSLTVSLSVVAGLYAAQLLMHLSQFTMEEILFSIGGTLLLSTVLYGRVSGGLLTVAWGCQGLALLAAGFPLNQRVLRLEGLALLFTCILKLFLYDLRNLETLYRILSFVALGVILLGVSWVYTRFQDQIKKLL
jgi:uncharacterized membrane protein